MREMYRIYYRLYGARYSNSLIDIRKPPVGHLSREAIYHAYSEDGGSPDVDAAMPYYQDYQKKILLHYVTDYVNPKGSFKKPMFVLNELTRNWRKSNLKHWQMEPDAWKKNASADQLIVVNYGYLDQVHRYIQMPTTKYAIWDNRWRTIFGTANKIAAESPRHQFIKIQIPEYLQGKTMLERFASRDFSIMALNIFGAYGMDGFLQLELWKWLGVTYREKSLFGLIEPKHYSKINFIFEGESGKSLLVNMAYLNSWIKEQPNQTEMSSIVQLPAMTIQLLFLKFCMVMNNIQMEESGEEFAQQTPVRKEPVKTDVVEPEEAEAETENSDGDAVETDGYAVDFQTDDTEESSVVNPDDISAPASSVKKQLSGKGHVMTDDEIDLKLDRLENKAVTNYTADLLNSIAEDIEALDKVSLTQLKNRGVKVNEETVEIPEKEEIIDIEVVKQKVFGQKTPAETLASLIAENAESNLITAADYRKMQDAVSQYEASPDPYGSGLTRKEAMVIKPEDVAVTPERKAIVTSALTPDKTMGSSTLVSLDRDYISKVMRKDILNTVNSLQNAGVIVRNHEIETVTTILGTYEHHKLELKPIDGAPSNIKFTLPKVEKDGTFIASNNKYLLRRGRVDVPLRKIAPSIVALSTYYGKTFVQTSPKVANSSVSWLHRQLNLAIVTEGSYIQNVSPGAVFNSEIDTPYIYGAIASEFEKFSAGNLNFYFNYGQREKFIDPTVLKVIERNGRVFCGFVGSKTPIVVDKDNIFYAMGDTEQKIGDIYQALKLPMEKSPVDFSEIRVFSKYIPVGVVMAYYIGFKALVALTNATHRLVPARKNKMLAADEYSITFQDQSYVFTRKDKRAALLFSGFAEYERTIKQFESTAFDHKDVYLNLFMSKGLGSIYVRELDMMENAFIDPISMEVLASMKEPTTFKGLLLRANEMLLTYHHPVSQDRSVMRDRGYERFAGLAYKELMKAVRQFRNKNMAGRSKIDISPYQVWNTIMADNSVKIVEDINPIQNLKEGEVITFAGEGGRSKETMTKPTRAFHINDVGVLSESTVDSTGVGTIAYLSTDPNIKDLRGMMSDEKVLNGSTMLSTSALLSPASFNDTAKRIMFITTQHSHTVASSSYRQPMLRTGYENVIGKRTGKMFCTAAEQDGVVESVTESGIVVKYASGEKDGIPLGRVYGKAEGTTYPHDLTSRLKAGMKFKKGDILTYNSKFFEPDFRDPREVCLKINTVANVAFLEMPSTHEDSSTISPSLGKLLQTEVVKMKSYVVDFKQNLRDLKKPGELVEPRDILMIIEDEITASSGSFSNESMDALKRLSNAAPRAGVSGTVEKVEIYYHGEKRDMSQSLRKLADRSDAVIMESCKSSNQHPVTGRVTEEYRVSGKPLELDKAEIRIYITVKAPSGVGDKLVFGHQMKSTIAEVHDDQIHTSDGQDVDAIFSYRSVAARGVHSPALVGTTTTLLEAIGKRAVKSYRGE